MIYPQIISVLFCFIVANSNQNWNQDISKTKVFLSIKKIGVKVNTCFEDVKITTNFDANNLNESYVNAKIRVKSISSGKANRDQLILSKKYFNEEKFKLIHLISTKIQKKEDGKLYLFANLKIKGITKKIEIPLVVHQNKNNLVLKSNFIIKREDFKIGEGVYGLSKSVNILVEFTGTK